MNVIDCESDEKNSFQQVSARGFLCNIDLTLNKLDWRAQSREILQR